MYSNICSVIYIYEVEVGEIVRWDSDYDRAKEIYEQAMEVVHGYVGQAVDEVEQLSEVVDELENENSRHRADELIGKILSSLGKIC
jgi:hypothetical protein